MHLQILATGGTIDKIYFDAASEYHIGEPVAGDLLARFKVDFDYEVVSLMKKDSLDMTDEDREQILRYVKSNPSEHFVITHGTDTMVETARVLSALENKTIVMVGAMQPAIVMHSDAAFNLGFACSAAQILPSGVYVAMNGRVFDPLRVKKCRSEMRFMSSDSF